MTSGKVEKLKSEKGDPLLFLPPFRGEIERGDLSTCQLFNLSTKRNVAGELLFAKIVTSDGSTMIAWRTEKKIKLKRNIRKGKEVCHAVCRDRPPQKVLLRNGDG